SHPPIRALLPLRLFEEPSRRAWCVEKKYAPGFGAGDLPGMRNAARHESTGARAADADPITDFDRDFPGQDVSDLVAVVMQVERRFGTGRGGLLKHHHALAGLAVQELERCRPARRHVPDRPAARRDNDALHLHYFLPG